MKWTPWRRSLRPIWMRDWSSERQSTTSCFKDTKTSRRKSRISRTLRESSLRKLSRTRIRDHKPQAARAWWLLEWVQECSNRKSSPRWWRAHSRVILLATQPPDPPTTEQHEGQDLNRSHKWSELKLLGIFRSIYFCDEYWSLRQFNRNWKSSWWRAAPSLVVHSITQSYTHSNTHWIIISMN